MEARVTVPDYQLSLAIGKEGQNARLAARLTGWRIDIRSDGAVGASAPAPRASTADDKAAEAAGYLPGGRPPVPPDVGAGGPDRKNRDFISPARTD